MEVFVESVMTDKECRKPQFVMPCLSPHCHRLPSDTYTHAHSRKIAGTGHVAIRRLASWHDAFIEPWIVWIVIIPIYFALLYFHNVPFHQLQCEPESTLWFWQPKSFCCSQDGQQKLFLVADLAEIMLVQHESDWGIWCCEGTSCPVMMRRQRKRRSERKNQQGYALTSTQMARSLIKKSMVYCPESREY